MLYNSPKLKSLPCYGHKCVFDIFNDLNQWKFNGLMLCHRGLCWQSFIKLWYMILTLTTQNLISSSLYHLRPILKISSKSVHKFLSNVANRCTNKVTDKRKNITSFRTGVVKIYIGLPENHNLFWKKSYKANIYEVGLEEV